MTGKGIRRWGGHDVAATTNGGRAAHGCRARALSLRALIAARAPTSLVAARALILDPHASSSEVESTPNCPTIAQAEEIARLQSEIEALRPDAERYRRIRAKNIRSARRPRGV